MSDVRFSSCDRNAIAIADRAQTNRKSAIAHRKSAHAASFNIGMFDPAPIVALIGEHAGPLSLRLLK